jgi:hypothetical protein
VTEDLRPVTWGELDIDDEIVDASGTVWRVAALDRTEETDDLSPAFRCKSLDEWVTITPKPRDGVVKVRPGGQAYAVSLLRDQVGASVVATRGNSDAVWHCAPWPSEHKGSLDAFKRHLNEAHRMYSDDTKSYARLLEAHEAAHNPEERYVGQHSIPHVHTRRTS